MIESVAQIVRFLTAVFLLSVTFYFQVFIDSDYAEKAAGDAVNPVPIAFRVAPFILGVLILDRMREEAIFPLEPAVLAIILYGSFLWLVWKGFWLVLDRHDLPPPQKRVPEYCRAAYSDIRTVLASSQIVPEREQGEGQDPDRDHERDRDRDQDQDRDSGPGR